VIFGNNLSGLLIGITAEYYTSNSFQPVKDLVNACRTGAATNIIYGLALGYLSCIPPAYILAACIYVSFELCDLYGVALAAGKQQPQQQQQQLILSY